MYLEQRTYTFHPGKMNQWLAAYETDGGPCSERHVGPLIGMFTTEVGTINRVVFLRGFDDIDTREAGIAAREADPQWSEFRKKAAGGGPSPLMTQESKFLKTVPFSPMHTAATYKFERRIGGTGMYVDHRTYDFHPGKAAAWIAAYEKTGLPIQQRLLGQLLFFAVTEIGVINQVVFAWAYESLGDRDRRRTAMANDPAWQEFGKEVGALGALKQQTVQSLKPVKFSKIR